MLEKPRTAAGYSPDQVELVKGTCLYVARILADLMDEMVIVGGLVPTLLIDQDDLPEGAQRHAGTRDLDVGLTIALFGERRYQALTERLRQSGFMPDQSASGNPTVQRWKYEGLGKVTIDFLVQPLDEGDRGGSIRHIENDFGAIVTPGLPLAFRDNQVKTISGTSITGARGSAEVRVCGPGAFVVLKALAFKGRNANKDAYDLYYVLRNYGSGVHDVAARLTPLLDSPEARAALDVLRRDFLTLDGFGPWGVAEFITGGPNEGIQAEMVGLVDMLLRALDRL